MATARLEIAQDLESEINGRRIPGTEVPPEKDFVFGDQPTELAPIGGKQKARIYKDERFDPLSVIDYGIKDPIDFVPQETGKGLRAKLPDDHFSTASVVGMKSKEELMQDYLAEISRIGSMEARHITDEKGNPLDKKGVVRKGLDIMASWDERRRSMAKLVKGKLSDRVKQWFEYEVIDEKIPLTDEKIAELINNAHETGKLNEDEFKLFEPILSEVNTENVEATLDANESDIPTPLSLNNKITFSDKAKDAYSQGLVGLSLMHVKRIENVDEKMDTIRDLVVEAVNNGKFSDARSFVKNIDDKSYRMELGAWVDSHVDVNKVNIRRNTGKGVEIKEDVPSVTSQLPEIKDDVTAKEGELVGEPDKVKIYEDSMSEPLPVIDLEPGSGYVVEKEQTGLQRHVKQESEIKRRGAIPMPESSLTKEKRPEPKKEDEPLPVVEEVAPVDLEKAVEDSRTEYVKHYIEYKNKIRSKKGWFAKHLADLGFDKQLPEENKPQELVDAEHAYAEAKKNRNQTLFAQTEKRSVEIKGQTLGFKEVTYEYNPKLNEAAEKEFEAFLAEVQDSMPPLEKGIAGKYFDKWQKWGTFQKRVFSTALLTGGNIVFGSLTLPAAAGFIGYRAARSTAVGTVVGKTLGKVWDVKAKENSAAEQERIGDEYSMEINMDNFEAREKDRMSQMESKLNQAKRQKIYKAVAMAAAGGVATVGTAGLESLYDHGGVVEHLDGVKDSASAAHEHMPASSGHAAEILDKKPEIQNTVVSDPVEVPVSAKGFIDTFKHVKEELVEKYGGVDKVPQGLRESILDKSDVDLAKQFHMYDPEHGLSGVGYKGETITLDDSGNLVYHHLGGKSDILIDSKTGVSHDFSGELKGGSIEEVKVDKIDVPEGYGRDPHIAAGVDEANNIAAKTSGASSESFVDPVKDIGGLQSHILHKGTYLDVENGVAGRVVRFKGIDLGHEHSVGLGKVFALDDKYQNGPEYAEYREAFSVFADKNIPETSKMFNPIGFEGGKVHILRSAADNDQVEVLLNGKQIANGLIKNGKIKLDILDEVKHSHWWQPPTVYERALRVAERVVKNSTLKQ